MNKLFVVLSIALVFGCSKPAEKPAEPAAAAEAKAVELKRDDKGNVTVTINEETSKRIDLKTDELKATQHTPELSAFGAVLDPASLITAQTDIGMTTVALETSRKAATRAKSLFDQGENVARKTLETAEADLRANEIKLKALQQQIALEWGESFANLSPTDLQTLVGNLVATKIVLARVDLPAGETLTNTPAAARISTIANTNWQAAKVISRAAKIDPKVQGEGFILQSDWAQLRPGAAVSALLPTAAGAQKGVVVPDAAVVQFIGKTWAYVQTGTNSFMRAEISQQSPVEGGWFEVSSVKAGDRVVVQGAQQLLSEEQKAQIVAD
jgi:membrane fusion protein, multidrug efflux system